jgi:hypothetical protein
MKILLPFFLFVVASCHSLNNVSLTFFNKSSFAIDSIVIQKPEKVIIGKITVGQQLSKSLNDVQLNTNNEGAFPFAVYRKDKVLTGTWGFHDFGMLSSKTETFYIHDNSITSTDKPLQKPKEFRLYFHNASSQLVDSIIDTNGAIIKVNEFSPRNFEVVYDYGKIEHFKEFAIAIDKKRWSSKIDHDFSNWNNNQIFLYFENDTLKKGTSPWREPLEFIVDLQVNLPFPSDSVKVESDAIVKTYYFHQPKYIKIVFDFKKLKPNPVFTVIAKNKKYQVDLSSHDFSNIYSNQKILYLEEKGIRSLTD